MWNIVKPGEGLEHWVGPQNAGWIPAEANLHPRKHWFWTPDSDQTLRDIPFLMNAYFETIGRGANLLINMTPDTSGLIPEAEVERLAEFGMKLNHTFASPIGYTSPERSESGNELFLNLPQKEPINLFVLEEDIEQGQHIMQYKVDAYVGNQWKTIAEGQSIGRKRIQSFDPVETTRLRLSMEGEKGRFLLKILPFT